MAARLNLPIQKLNTVPVPDLRELAGSFNLERSGRQGHIIDRLVDQDQARIDAFIKRKYREKVAARRENLISDADLLAELSRVEGIDWGVVQGQLDGKIQRDYVRVCTRYDELLGRVRAQLHGEITNYAIASWYNHWSTVLIEDHISLHDNVVPTIKNVGGVDVFFRDCPFDLKITYLPRNYDLADALNNPTGLARWLYENQGAQRFGADNRFYVVVVDREDVEQSWRLKRNFPLLADRIDHFLATATVSDADELRFVFNGRAYSPLCKILIITQ